MKADLVYSEQQFLRMKENLKPRCFSSAFHHEALPEGERLVIEPLVDDEGNPYFMYRHVGGNVYKVTGEGFFCGKGAERAHRYSIEKKFAGTQIKWVLA